ncbi:MarR family winged helix-turn-helix transcriptional regulator [Arthrobacter sp. MDT2-2]
MWSLIRASRKIERVLADVLADYGLTPTQFGVLAQLDGALSLTQADLARTTFERPQSMPALLKGLEGRHLIARSPARARGNRQPFELTDRGRVLLSSARPAVQSTNDPRRYGLSSLDATLLNATLQSILTTG